MKGKSSSGGIKAFFLQHGEKIGLGVTALILLLFFWSAMGVKPIEESKKPEKLVADASRVTTAINESVPENLPEPPKDLAERVLLGMKNMPSTVYHHVAPYQQEVVAEIVKRPVPQLFPVEDLRVTPVAFLVPVNETPAARPDLQSEEKKKKEEKAKKAKSDKAKKARTRRGGYPPTGYPNQARGKGKAGASADEGGGGYPPPGGGYPPTTGYGRAGGVYPPGYPPPSSESDTDMPSAVAYQAGQRPGPELSGMRDRASGEVRIGAVLTGRVPFAKQLAEYQSKFKDAHRPAGSQQVDAPTYLEIKVERQEVGKQEWVVLDLEAAVKDETRWVAASVLQDLVDPAYKDDAVTWPTPPAIMRNWGLEAVHPSIPTTFHLQAQQAELGRDKEADAQHAKQLLEQRRRKAPGSAQDASAIPAVTAAEGPPQVLPTVDAVLFRFVDTQKLEAGKQYRYRVSLELANPNYDLPPVMLVDGNSRFEEGIWTPPSETTIPMTMPNEEQLLATGLNKRSGRSLAEVDAKFLFRVLDKTTGSEVGQEFELELGGIAEFVKTVENHYLPFEGIGKDLENFKFKFDEGAPMLADVHGGERLPGKGDRINQPTELLFFDAAGDMFTANEAQDAITSKYYEQWYTLKTQPEPGIGIEQTDGPSLLDTDMRNQRR